MEQFFSDEDLLGILDELDEIEAEIEIVEEDQEMEASNRRYEEIIRKHKM